MVVAKSRNSAFQHLQHMEDSALSAVDIQVTNIVGR